MDYECKQTNQYGVEEEKGGGQDKDAWEDHPNQASEVHASIIWCLFYFSS
jgi:hypothetical protein